MREYTREGLYIESKKSIRAKITAVQAIINALITAATDSAGTGGIDEYQLDDGQTKIRQTYRSVEDIWKAINGFEKQKQYYINQLDGRQMRNVPEQNFY